MSCSCFQRSRSHGSCVASRVSSVASLKNQVTRLTTFSRQETEKNYIIRRSVTPSCRTCCLNSADDRVVRVASAEFGRADGRWQSHLMSVERQSQQLMRGVSCRRWINETRRNVGTDGACAVSRRCNRRPTPVFNPFQ